jgi:hypothetical protein
MMMEREGRTFHDDFFIECESYTGHHPAYSDIPV